MAGLVKAKKYDWKDSNLALFGSDTEKQVKKESAETEPAWSGAGQEVGVKVWRIEKFKVKECEKDDYGKFYSGDSYIVLNTYKEEVELKYDVHFWIGKYSTQDEYGTAAYKTVELDTFLDDKAVQHREVQGHESAKFKSYFGTIELLEGGVATGFHKVKPEEYKPRLLHVSGTKRQVSVKEVSRSKSNVTSKDVFILDMGLTIYQFNGKDCSKDEKYSAGQFVANLRSERNGRPSIEVLDEDVEEVSDDHEFYQTLDQEADEDEDEGEADESKKLFRLSDATGKITFEDAEDLDNSDVFLLDSGKHMFVWVGSGASANEKKNGFAYAHKYLSVTRRNHLPVSVVNSGRETTEFNTAMAA